MARAHNAAFDAVTEAKIVAEYLSGETGPALAARYGVSFVSIYNYVRRAGHTIRPPTIAARTHEHDDQAFETLTPESAYWLGMLMTDGCVRLRPNPSLQYGAAEVDAGHVESFRAFLKATHPIQIRSARPALIVGRMCKSTAYHSLVIPSTPLVASVRRWGVEPGKTYSASVDPRLKDNVDFWRGAIDGDGTLGSYKGQARIEIVSAGLLAHQFGEFVRKRFPKTAAQARRAREHTFVFSTSCNLACDVIALLYVDAVVALPRKAERARQILARSLHG